MHRAAPFGVAVCLSPPASRWCMAIADRVFLARATNFPEAAHSMHLSTGLIGTQHRYVMMIESQQPADEETARDTINPAVKTMFPGGRT